DDAYLTLKVCTLAKVDSVVTPQYENEIAASRHLQEVCADDEGQQYVRTVLDDFVVTGPHGQHLAHQLLFECYHHFVN
ncbi:hypothetical protein CPB84DRAFT_1623426, partial [Gymnopilus junonius]